MTYFNREGGCPQPPKTRRVGTGVRFPALQEFCENGEHRASPIAIRVWHTDLFTADAVRFLASAVRREQIRLSAFLERNGQGEWTMGDL